MSTATGSVSGLSLVSGLSNITSALTVGGKPPAEGPPIQKVTLAGGSVISVRLYVKIPSVPADQSMESIANAADRAIKVLANHAQKNAEDLVDKESTNFESRRGGNRTHITSIRKSSRILPDMSVQLVLRFSAVPPEEERGEVVDMVKKLAAHIASNEDQEEGIARRANYASTAANRTLQGDARSRRSRFTQFAGSSGGGVRFVRGSGSTGAASASAAGKGLETMLADLRAGIMIDVTDAGNAQQAFQKFAKEQATPLAKLIAKDNVDDKDVLKEALATMEDENLVPYRTLFKNMARVDPIHRDDVAQEVAPCLRFEGDDPGSTTVALDALGAYIAELADELSQTSSA